MATFDRMFIACNIEEEDLEDNPDRALCRYEFLEILVRMAHAKYGVSIRPLHQSLQILLDEYVYKHTTIYEWQSFRERELWNNREVNLTLEANMLGLKELHKSFFTKTQPYMSYQDAISLFTVKIKSFVTFRDATLCYGLSKMSVIGDF